MANPFKNKVALITGGTGSFGQAVVAPLLARGVREIRIFSRDELKQEAMRIEQWDGVSPDGLQPFITRLTQAADAHGSDQDEATA